MGGDGDGRDGSHGEATPARLRELAEQVDAAESNGGARGLLRREGDLFVGAVATGLGVRQLAVIRRPPRRGGYAGLVILQPCDSNAAGRLFPSGSSILLDGRAIPRLASLIADVLESELAEAQVRPRPPASRTGGPQSTTTPAVTRDQHDGRLDDHDQNGAA